MLLAWFIALQPTPSPRSESAPKTATARPTHLGVPAVLVGLDSWYSLINSILLRRASCPSRIHSGKCAPTQPKRPESCELPNLSSQHGLGQGEIARGAAKSVLVPVKFTLLLGSL